jgi:hypothetical protein
MDHKISSLRRHPVASGLHSDRQTRRDFHDDRGSLIAELFNRNLSAGACMLRVFYPCRGVDKVERASLHRQVRHTWWSPLIRESRAGRAGPGRTPAQLAVSLSKSEKRIPRLSEPT